MRFIPYVVTKEGMKRMEDQGKSASTTPSGYKIVESVNGYGVMDDRGNMLVTPIHLAVLGKQGEEFIVETLSKKGVYNRSLQPLIPVQFDQITGYDARFDYEFLTL